MANRWEYMLMTTWFGPSSKARLYTYDEWLEKLNELGAQGWEAVSGVELLDLNQTHSPAVPRILLKRPKG